VQLKKSLCQSGKKRDIEFSIDRKFSNLKIPLKGMTMFHLRQAIQKYLNVGGFLTSTWREIYTPKV
jgi:hypothetical protein